MQKSPVFTSSLIVSCLVTPALAQPFPMPERPPNIVIILTDDLGYNDIGAYTWPNQVNPDATDPAPFSDPAYSPIGPANSAANLTPRIDSLAANGIRMTDYYSSAPLCTPARAALLTGCYGYRVGMPEVVAPTFGNTKGLADWELTLPELLKERGYATAAVGKWHVGHQPQFLPMRHGFDTFFGIPYSHDMWPIESASYPPLPFYDGEGTLSSHTTASGHTLTSPIDSNTESSYMLEAMTERAIGFIQANRSGPFFLYFAPHAPHTPCWPHPDFAGDSGVSNYYDVIMELDHRVGQILDELDTLGLANNTLVIFTSDNGPAYPRNEPREAPEQAVGSAYPLWEGKRTPWEGGSRVPFMARWPGEIPAGAVSSEIGEHVDLLPTLVQLAGGSVPTDRTIDGGDLWPVISGQLGAASPDNRVYFFNNTSVYALREGDWKYFGLSSGTFSTVAGTLIDLPNDIQERSNVTNEPDIESSLASTRSAFVNEINSNKRSSGVFSTQGIVVSSTTLSVNEGSSASIYISLEENPGGSFEVIALNISGDGDLSISAGASLIFDSGNWDTPQTLTIAAAEDADMVDGTGVIRLSGPNVPNRFVYATESDNDSVPGVEPGLVWPKVAYATLQDANHGLIADGTATINTIRDPAGTSYAWSHVGGDPVTFEDVTAKKTGVTFSAAGDYVLRLTTGYPGATSLATDFQVRVDPAGATPPEQDPVQLPVANSSFESGSDPQINDWFEENDAGGSSGNDNFAEVRQLEISATSVPSTPAGSYWLNLATRSDTGFSAAVYQSLGTWQAGGGLRYELSALLGDRSNQGFGTVTFGLWKSSSSAIGADGLTMASRPGALELDSATFDFTESGASTAPTGTFTLDAAGVGDGDLLWVRISASGSEGNQHLIDDLVIVTVPGANIAPVIDPGAEQTTAYSVNLMTLAGAVTDDGLPGGGVTTNWIQTGGPGTATFADPAALNSSVSFDYPGAYKLRLIADDGQIKAFRDRTMMLAGLSMEEWAVAESVPPGQAGPLDNPDRDPWHNLWEFALGLNPNHPEGAAMPIDYMIAAPAMTSVVSFKVPRDRLPAIVFETSPDLKDWYSSGIEPTIEVLDAEWAQWNFTYTPEIASDPFFLRLSVTEPHIE